MTSLSTADARVWVNNLTLQYQMPAALVSLESGAPGVDCADDTRLGDAIRRVRTHLDAFTLRECGALAYCGYSLMDRALMETKFNPADFNGLKFIKPLSLAKILPDDLGSWFVSTDDLRDHLYYSQWRMSPFRWLGRTFVPVAFCLWLREWFDRKQTN